MKREAGFTCIYSSEHGEGRSWVRAWDEVQATSAVRTLLRECGEADAVLVRVERAGQSGMFAPRRPQTPR